MTYYSFLSDVFQFTASADHSSGWRGPSATGVSSKRVRLVGSMLYTLDIPRGGRSAMPGEHADLACHP